nr:MULTISPECIES: FkbM family methyltransferase [unclassified Ectothiorhodospira]
MIALNHFDVDLIFDVGANAGQYALEMRSIGYKGKIVSFEPLTDAHSRLLGNASKDRLWDVHERTAIGDKEGKVEINSSQNSVSSSILHMLESHKEAASTSGYIGKETVDLNTLDSIGRKYIKPNSRYYIKIDTQGFESQVLDGAKDILRDAVGVQLELSLAPLYEGQTLWRDLIDRLEREGFTLWALQQGFTNKENGRTLQTDGIFFREA